MGDRSDVASSVLHVAPGRDLLARRGDALLLCGADDVALMSAFLSAAPRSAVVAVTETADRATSAAGPFAIVDWSSPRELRVVVNGDVELQTDHPNLPRLSAAGVGTWVERPIRAVEGAVVVTIGSPDADEATDLRAGVVRAGGCRLQLPPPAGTAAGAAPADSSRRPAGVDDAPPLTGNDSDRALSEASSTTRRRAADMTAALAAASGVAESPPPAKQPAPAHDARAPKTRPAVPPKEVEDRTSGSPADTPASRRPSGEPGAPAWRLEFTDGRAVDVDHAVVFGQDVDIDRADVPSGAAVEIIDSAVISRTHLLVRVDGAGLEIVDLGSRNGTFVIASGDGEPIQLTAATPHRVEDGTWVQLGDRRFRAVRVASDTPQTDPDMSPDRTLRRPPKL